MSRIIRIGEDLFVDNKRRIDLIWIVKPKAYKKNKYGVMNIQTINFPNRYVGRKYKIMLVPVEKKKRKK